MIQLKTNVISINISFFSEHENTHTNTHSHKCGKKKKKKKKKKNKKKIFHQKYPPFQIKQTLNFFSTKNTHNTNKKHTKIFV